MSEPSLHTSETKRKSRALSPERQEERALAWRQAGKESHDRLSAAVQQWARYTDPKGKGPTRDERTYYQSFKRMMHARLGLPQGLNRDLMNKPELLAISTMEQAVAAVLEDGIARGQSRKEIKERYADVMDALGRAHQPILKLQRQGGTA